MSFGFGSGEKRSPEQIAEIEAANRMEAVDFTTPSGSQGVTNSNYADYVRRNPDLMANYNKHWKAGAPEPLSGKNEGISLAEYGAMHWNQSGRNEGRSMPGLSSAPAPESGGGGGGNVNPPPELGPYPANNIYFPILETEYTAPNAQDFSAYMPVDGLLTGGAQARYPQAIFPPLDEAGGVLPQTPSEPITDGQQFDIGGLLYQPFSTEYQQAFVPGNIWQYDPNQFGVGEVSYRTNPMGELKLPEDWEDLLGPFEEPEEESDDEGTPLGENQDG